MVLTALGTLHGRKRYLLASAPAARGWLAAHGAVDVVGAAYFLAPRLGLALLSAPSDVAVFWPASGIAAGILIISGRRAYPALVSGVVVGTIAANVMSDRSLLTSLFKGFCNSGEAVLAAWLLEQWFGRHSGLATCRGLRAFSPPPFLQLQPPPPEAPQQ